MPLRAANTVIFCLKVGQSDSNVADLVLDVNKRGSDQLNGSFEDQLN